MLGKAAEPPKSCRQIETKAMTLIAIVALRNRQTTEVLVGLNFDALASLSRMR